MKRRILFKLLPILGLMLALGILLTGQPGAVDAQGPETQGDIGIQQIPLGTAFTYQGRLVLDGSPASGDYDFRFDLYDVGFGGTPLGTKLISISSLTDGLFKLDLDFGSGIFTGDARFLEISVRQTGSPGGYTTLIPRQQLRPTPYALALPGLWTQPNDISPNVIGGFSGNEVINGVVGATISGGGIKAAADEFGNNTVTDNYGTVGGGRSNLAGDQVGTTMDAAFATVGGGRMNIASGRAATVSGGDFNWNYGNNATIGGGSGNQTHSNDYATIGGGANNQTGGEAATIGGGAFNEAMANYATIAGGGFTDPTDPHTGNRVTDNYGTVGGGGNNQAGDGAGTTDDTSYNTVSGGYSNIASGEYPTNVVERGFATVSGGRGNEASGIDAAIGGGKENIASGESATVGGGLGNKASGFRATIGGGLWNKARSYIVTIGGGYGNIAGGEGTMDGWLATVGGGYYNTASGNNSTIGGGFLNTASFTDTTISGGRENEANGESATVPGGSDNTAAGDYSFAAGRHAKANHNGTFVWADSTSEDFESTGPNQFLVRANGGAVFTGDVTHGSMLDVTNLSNMYSYGIYGRGGSTGVVGSSEYGIGVSGNGITGVYGGSVYTDGIGVRADSLKGNPIEAYGGTPSDREFYVSNSGNVYADGTFNPGGADLAEMLPAVGGLEPGEVLVVGSDGKLTHSTQAYQPTVVGVHSTQPGFVGGAGEDANLSGKVPLAVVGVVPVKASAENGSIHPGDLLTTSDTPGHAMKAGPNPPVGTVIGKALEGLDEDTGMIQMLVILQ